MSDKENAFDLLKLIGAYIVLLSHAFRHFEVTKPAWSLFFTEGSVGVMIFFAITGFVMMPAYERSLEKSNSIFPFYWNRIIRLFPPILFSFLIITVLNIYVMDINVFSIDYVIYGIKYCIFARGGGYGTNGISNGVLWTIVPDVVFYALTPFVYRFMKNQKTWVWIVLILIFWQFNVWDKQVITLVNMIPIFRGHVGASLSICFLYEFLIGSYLYFKKNIIISYLKSRKNLVYSYLLIFTVFFEIYTYGNCIPKTGEMHTPWFGIMVAPLTIVMAYIIKPFRLRFDLSFGIFLFHMIIVNLLIKYGVNGVIGIILTAMMSPCVAYLFNRYIETNLKKLKQ